MEVNEISLYDEDIHKILKRKMKTTSYELLFYQLKPFSERIGLLGDHATLKVSVQRVEAQEPESFSFFIKFFPMTPVSKEFAEKTGAFDKEIFTHEELFANIKSAEINILKQCTAECYLTENNRMLVFDDLIEEGFEVLNKHQVFEYDGALVVLKSLAKLHASSIIYEEKKSEELGRKYRLNLYYENKFEETFYNDREGFINLKGVVASIKGVMTEIDLFKCPSKLLSGKDFKTEAERCCFRIYDMVKPTNKFRSVICHGDLWSANLLMKYNQNKIPIQCKFVDFQMTRYLPPSHDVMSVLHLTTSRDFRKKHMYELIGLYYVALESHLKLAGYDIKTILPFMDFLESCEEQKPFVLMQAATYFQLILLDSDELKEFYANETLSNYALYEDRSALVLAYINQNESYRNRLKDSIEDLQEYCERF